MARNRSVGQAIADKEAKAAKKAPATKPAAKAEKPAAKAEKPAAKATKPVVTKPAAKATKAPAKKAAGESKGSAAQLFQDLIMEGKLSDDQIFAKVKAEYGLDDKKRSYVGWYRNHLRKAGKNPPDAK